MNKILVVFTGGTISSRKKQNDERDVDKSMSYLLLSSFRNHPLSSRVQFEIAEPYNVLSENCTYWHWQRLANTLLAADLTKYIGVVIAHGSDTLPYSTAFLSFLLGANTVPIVFVASNHPLDNPLSTGQHNFNSAISFILGGARAGVYAIYKNSGTTEDVFLGSRLTEADRYTDEFSSFGGVNFGKITDGGFKVIKHANNPRPIKASPYKMPTQIDLKKRVVALRSYPGQDFTNLKLNNDVAAVIISLYHSATTCIAESGEGADLSTSFKVFLEQCRKEGKDVYLCSFKNDAETYKGAGSLIEGGAIALYNICFEAAYAKLCVAYNSNVNAREFMLANVFYEFLK